MTEFEKVVAWCVRSSNLRHAIELALKLDHKGTDLSLAAMRAAQLKRREESVPCWAAWRKPRGSSRS